MPLAVAAREKGLDVLFVESHSLGERVAKDAPQVLVEHIQRDVLVEAGISLDGDGDFLGLARLQRNVIVAERNDFDVATAEDADGVGIDEKLVAAAAGVVDFLVGDGRFGNRKHLAAGEQVRRLPPDDNVAGCGAGIGGSFEDDAAVLDIGRDFAAGSRHAGREVFNLQLHFPREAILASRSHKDRGGSARHDLGLVGIDEQVEAGLATGGFQDVGELRPAPKVDVPDFQDVLAIGRGGPVLDERIGRAPNAAAKIVVYGELLALRIEQAQIGIETGLQTASLHLEGKRLASLGIET